MMSSGQCPIEFAKTKIIRMPHQDSADSLIGDGRR